MTTAPVDSAVDSRVNLLNLSPAEAQARLMAYLERAGEPKYRAAQITRRLWLNPAPSFEQMTELPKALRESLATAFELPRLEVAARQKSSDGTEKFLFRLADGEAIESVAIPEGDRVTLCISSQAGCALQCAFCATGAMGFSRNLSTFEIAGQVREMRLHEPPIDITNVVFMGMGEPLLNLDRVLAAVEALADSRRFGLGARHITVSTSGVVPGIRRLTALGPQFTLAVSLHAARDPLRDVLVPLNRRWPVAEVVEAAREHVRATGRRISYEVTLIGGVNDTDLDAQALADLLRDDHAHVNLIPMNPVAHTPWQASPMDRIERFAALLLDAGITTTIRRNRGQEIGAACGQLAAEHAGEPAAPAVARRRDRIESASAAALRGERSLEAAPVGVGE
jgi:23S rRNA (adenine2503-C2)-methyltransferase